MSDEKENSTEHGEWIRIDRGLSMPEPSPVMTSDSQQIPQPEQSSGDEK